MASAMDFGGGDPQEVNATIDTCGHSDWSIGNLITLDMGGEFMHEIYVMNLDGSNLHQVSQGNNAHGESFSPDGKWIAFTAYTAVANKNQARCEIYIMRADGTDRRGAGGTVSPDHRSSGQASRRVLHIIQ